MDGLLIDSEPLWRKAQETIFKKLDVELTTYEFEKFMGMRTLEVVKAIHKEHSWGGPSDEEVTQMIFEEIIRLIKSEGKMLPGVIKCLEEVDKLGKKIVIASSSPQIVIDAVLDKLEISHHFHELFSAEFEPFGKPHPGIFIKVAETYGVHNDHCVVFEDSPNGVIAAKAAKMKCIAVPDEEFKNNNRIHAADLVLDSLENYSNQLLEKL